MDEHLLHLKSLIVMHFYFLLLYYYYTFCISNMVLKTFVTNAQHQSVSLALNSD